MAVKIYNSLGYMSLDVWILANVIQLGTQEFCEQFLRKGNDPCGRQYDQMTQAARSGVANIAEGYSRHQTSRETEMKLMDVARASLAEFREQGGFTENMTAERLAALKEKSIAESAPKCPKCGAPMVKTMAKKGINAGREFWSCTNYRITGCRGSLDIPITRQNV